MSWTLTFREDVKGWVSFKSFIPENAISMANDYYSFKDGNLYIHHNEGGNRNTFYGVLKDSSFRVIMNSFPDVIKSFNTLNYEGTQSKIDKFIEYQVPGDTNWYTDRDYYNLQDHDGWYVDNVFTNMQNGTIPEFIEKESKWFNYIKGVNITTNINGLVTNHLDPSEFSFQGLGYVDDVNIYVGVFGCTDPQYLQYDPNANIDDGSCVDPIVEGCMNSSAINYNCATTNWANPGQVHPNSTTPCTDGVNVDDGSCVILGCTDPTQFNYDPNATQDDGSCIAFIYGCLNSLSNNFDSLANSACNSLNVGCTSQSNPACSGPAQSSDPPQGGCCEAVVWGCTNPTSSNYDPNANQDDGSCLYAGCGNPIAYNYNILVNLDCNGALLAGNSNPDWSCCCLQQGCMVDSGVTNYDPNACADCGGNMPNSVGYTTGSNNTTLNDPNLNVNMGDDSCCIECIYGCMNPTDANYDPNATCQNNSACDGTYGCTNVNADNYDQFAGNDDGSCEFCASPSWNGQTGSSGVWGWGLDTATSTNPSTDTIVLDFSDQNTTAPYDAPLQTVTFSWNFEDDTYCNANAGSTGQVYNAGPDVEWPNIPYCICTVATGCGFDTIYYPTMAYPTGSSGSPPTTDPAVHITAGAGSSPFTLDNLIPDVGYTFHVTGHCLTTTWDAGSQTFTTLSLPVSGCTDSNACNYNPNASTDDGSCNYYTCAGCMDTNATNYNSSATCACSCDPNSGNYNTTNCCAYPVITGCMDTSVGKYADRNGDVNSTMQAVPTPGSVPCQYGPGSSITPTTFINNNPEDGIDVMGTNPFMHTSSTVENCRNSSNALVGHRAIFGPSLSANVTYCETNACGYRPSASQSATGGNRSSGIFTTSNNGCFYDLGCTDNGNMASWYNYRAPLGVPANGVIPNTITLSIPSASANAWWDAVDTINTDPNHTSWDDGPPAVVRGVANGYTWSGYTSGSLTPGEQAFNYDPNATIDDGSCIPKIYGCYDEYDMTATGGARTNWNVGRGHHMGLQSSNHWPTALFMDIPVPYFATRRDNAGSHPIYNNSLIPWQDVNTHDQSACIHKYSGCSKYDYISSGTPGPATGNDTANTYSYHDGTQSSNTGATWVNPIYPDKDINYYQWQIPMNVVDYGYVWPESFAEGDTYNTALNLAYSQGNGGYGPYNHPLLPSGGYDYPELYEKSGTTPGSYICNQQYGAYNYFCGAISNGNYIARSHGNEPGTSVGLGDGSDLYNISQPWSPVNMDACCFTGGCLHPQAYNFDLIGYERKLPDYANYTYSNHIITGNKLPTASLNPMDTDNPFWDMTNANNSTHTSCAFCNGDNAADYFRDYTQLDLSTAMYDEEWDGTLGLNSSAQGATWFGVIDLNTLETEKKFNCCCFQRGCMDGYDANNTYGYTSGGLGAENYDSDACIHVQAMCCTNNTTLMLPPYNMADCDPGGGGGGGGQ